MKTAREQFLDRGWAKFSLRGVAAKSGVSLGHLQHYFRTKSDLVMAMLIEASSEYVETYESLTSSTDMDAREQLVAALTHLVRDARADDTVRFFVEYWAVSARSEPVHDLLRDRYRANWKAFGQFVAAARPDLDPASIDSRARTLIMLVDGFIIYVHSERPSNEEFDRSLSSTVEAALACVYHAAAAD